MTAPENNRFEKRVFTVILLTFLSLLALAALRDANKAKWARFEACIESHPSDYVCDSCYTDIFK